MPNKRSSSSSVGVVTVSFASDDVLPAFLASIPAASSQPLTVIVADNKPDDGSISSVVIAAGFQYLPMSGNLGYGGAVNAAVKTLAPNIQWLVIGNPDVTIDTGAIDLMLSCAQSDSRIALVGPQIVDEGGVVYPSARAIPSLRTGIGHALFANIWPDNPWSRDYITKPLPKGLVQPAGCPELSSLRADRRSRNSADLTKVFSCTSRTWTSATDSDELDG